ncbi:RebB family R body protein [Maricaulis parjimensis]|uniref:RebB family R body protein n=1 Tax=Maricaulis parjimensis TaxID=144023 RepID=UPI001939A583|nr:RebB family R body protein [Maricaulis parjimensis]
MLHPLHWTLLGLTSLGLAASAAAQDADIVNPQITDAVTQANVKVVGDAPEMAMGNLYQATGQALGNAAHNATNAQQNQNVLEQASSTQGVSTLLDVDTAATGLDVDKILPNETDSPE